MKKVIAVATAILVAVSMNAQDIIHGLTAEEAYAYENAIQPGMKYSQYKDLYNTAYYEKADFTPYRPFWAGFESLVIPGLGQVLEGEYLRGAAFLGANAALQCIYFYRLTELGEDSIRYAKEGCKGVSYLVRAAGIAVNIWALCDAVHVAKIKTMYCRELKSRFYSSVSVEPSFDCVALASGTTFPTAGLSLNIAF